MCMYIYIYIYIYFFLFIEFRASGLRVLGFLPGSYKRLSVSIRVLQGIRETKFEEGSFWAEEGCDWN